MRTATLNGINYKPTTGRWRASRRTPRFRFRHSHAHSRLTLNLRYLQQTRALETRTKNLFVIKIELGFHEKILVLPLV